MSLLKTGAFALVLPTALPSLVAVKDMAQVIIINALPLIC